MFRFTLVSALLIAAFLGVASSSLSDEVGRIRVEGPLGATIVLDGEEVGSISDSLGILMLDGVRAGAHAVAAVSEGYASQVVTVWLAPGSERVARFRQFSSAEWDLPGSTPEAPASWGSIALQSRRQECAVEIPELGLSGTSSPEAPWLADSLSPGRYSVRLFMGDFTTDLVLDVHPDTLTQILVGFGDELAEQRFHAFSLLDTSAFPFDRDGRVRQRAIFFTVFDEPPQIIEQVPPEAPSVSVKKRAGDYYLTMLQGKITSNWKQPSARFTEGDVLTVRVSFNVLRSGSIADLGVSRSSNWPALDESAVEAVHASAPFAELPASYLGDRLDVTIDFTVTH